MPSVFTLEGPSLGAHHFPPRRLTTSPLGISGLSHAAANFWLGVVVGIGGAYAYGRWVAPQARAIGAGARKLGAKARSLAPAKRKEQDEEYDLSHQPMDGARRRARRARRKGRR